MKRTLYPAPVHEKRAPAVEKNLKVVDTIDFEKHIEDLKAMLVYAPDISRSLWPRLDTGRMGQWTMSGRSGIARIL